MSVATPFHWQTYTADTGVPGLAPVFPSAQVKINRNNSGSDVTNLASASLALNNPSGSQTIFAFAFAGVVSGALRGDSSNNFVFSVGDAGNVIFTNLDGSVPFAYFNASAAQMYLPLQVIGGVALAGIINVSVDAAATSQVNITLTATNTIDIGATVSAVGLNLSGLDASRFVATDGSKNLVSADAALLIAPAVSATGQTADIVATAFPNIESGGLFRVSFYLQATTTAIAAGAVLFNLAWTDAGGSKSPGYTSSPVVLTSLTGMVQATVFIQSTDGVINYSTSHTGIFSTAVYRLDARIERLA